MTHKELVFYASKWLKRKCPVVILGLATTGETPDAIGWHGKFSILIECKSSLRDFMSDKKKWFRRREEDGLGQNRYFLTPEKLISIDRLPEGWGLMEVINNKVTITKESKLFQCNIKQEVGILLSTLRRIKGVMPEGSSIKCYNHNTQNTSEISFEIQENNT
ncbi:MAG: hypothetical protein ABFD15_06635 [Methanofastidiosum sp.]